MNRTCECGCGQSPKVGNRFINGHQSAARRREEPRDIQTVQCGRCGERVTPRVDGSLGRHWLPHRGGLRARNRYRCPAGEPGARLPRSPQGRRVTVTVEVVIPHGWTLSEYKAMAAALLRKHATDEFVVSVSADEQTEEAS